MTKKAIFLSLLALTVLFLVTMIQDKLVKFHKLPFKCATFTRYILKDKDREIIMNISQDLRLYNKNNGYFLLNGTIETGDKKSFFNRVVRLDKGALTQGKTFSYEIKSTEKLDGDNTDDKLFYLLLNEYRTGSRDFQIDVFRIDKLTWLTRGPFAFINTCTRY
jgi:hypothetical protein